MENENKISLNSAFSLKTDENGDAQLQGWAIHGGTKDTPFIVNEIFQVPQSEMKNCAETLRGAKLMKNHDHNNVDAIVGKVSTTKSALDEEAGLRGVKYTASLVVDDTHLAKKIEKGLIDATSIGFSFTPICSICNNNYFSEECNHIIGYDEDMTLITKDMNCCELSLVPFGADPHATVSSSEFSQKVKQEFAQKKEDFIMSKTNNDEANTLREENLTLSQEVKDLKAQIEQAETTYNNDVEELKLAHQERELTLAKENEALQGQINEMGEELAKFRAEEEKRHETELAKKATKLHELAKQLNVEDSLDEEMTESFMDKQIAMFERIIEKQPVVPKFKANQEDPLDDQGEERVPFDIGKFFRKGE